MATTPTPSRKRRPVDTDLSKEQREIFDALPEGLRESYLAQLPAITVSNVHAQRKAKILRARAACIDRLLQAATAQRDRLLSLAKNLDQGGNPDAVDLREEMKPPIIRGVVVRFIRGLKEE